MRSFFAGCLLIACIPFFMAESEIVPCSEKVLTCERIVPIPLAGLKTFDYCPELDKVWLYDIWGEPGRFHRQRIERFKESVEAYK